MNVSLNQSVALHTPESLGQHLGRNLRNRVLQFARSQSLVSEKMQDRDPPLVGKKLDGVFRLQSAVTEREYFAHTYLMVTTIPRGM